MGTQPDISQRVRNPSFTNTMPAKTVDPLPDVGAASVQKFQLVVKLRG